MQIAVMTSICNLYTFKMAVNYYTKFELAQKYAISGRGVRPKSSQSKAADQDQG